MRHPIVIALCIGTAALSACGRGDDADVTRALKSVNVIDESNLSDIMLTVGDPNEAVAYFTRTAGENPDRIDLKRGLAKSLIRAQRPQDAARVWAEVISMPGATLDDKVDLAEAQLRSNEWKAAEATLNTIPPRMRRSSATGWRRWWPTATRTGKRPTVSTKSRRG